jgi:hypothetical protein
MPNEDTKPILAYLWEYRTFDAANRALMVALTANRPILVNITAADLDKRQSARRLLGLWETLSSESRIGLSPPPKLGQE